MIGRQLEGDELDVEQLAVLGVELQQLSGVCQACAGESGEQDEPEWSRCPTRGGTGQGKPVDRA
ncbi:hypothetical protein [Pseudomonas chlororaphis]|uniref:hypothetical protein n=1 Tax=Pseudomonas chlororaphis TaxID=587753 RepID=UPI00240792AD|nr:hypothetical protein [Pseudomonas chlororaphis]